MIKKEKKKELKVLLKLLDHLFRVLLHAQAEGYSEGKRKTDDQRTYYQQERVLKYRHVNTNLLKRYYANNHYQHPSDDLAQCPHTFDLGVLCHLYFDKVCDCQTENHDNSSYDDIRQPSYEAVKQY